MYNNLLKSVWINYKDDDSRVIDSNETIVRRMVDGDGQPSKKRRVGGDGQESEGGFISGIDVEELEGMEFDPDDPGTVIHSAPAQEDPPEPVYDGPSPEELIAAANEEIEKMRIDAQAQIASDRAAAMAQAKKQGYDEGYRDGKAKADKELENEKSRLAAEYDDMKAQLEPALVKEISGIYEHIFHVQLGEYENLAMRLIENCMEKIDNAGDYIIHVSAEDYPYVSLQKSSLAEEMGGRGASIEIVEDATLKKNECMIEVEGGIYDCSLDVQLSALRKELRLISYDGTE